MFAEDIFDGWLAVHGSFLSEESERVLEAPSYISPVESSDLNDIANVNKQNLSQSYPDRIDDSPTEVLARTRRGHTKTRSGCITCKRRKIKCPEQRPSCANCIKRGCPCKYPSTYKPTKDNRIIPQVSQNPRPLIKLTDTPVMYSANDMRLFHHFLVAAHPCIPHEMEDVWVRDLPVFGHQYTYLMHAMLALADSHISLLIEDPKESMALSHRQKAIVGLEEAFTRWPPKAEEAHVMLATSYLLAFQSSYISDGFLDHILSLRGCALVSQLIHSNGLEGTFTTHPTIHSESLELQLKHFPALDQDLVRDALRSLAEFSHLLSAPYVRGIERALFAQLVGTLHPLLAPMPGSAPDTSPTPSLIGALECYNSELRFCSPALSYAPRCCGSPSETPILTRCFLCAVPSPNTHINNPLFPDGPSASYEEISCWSPDDIINVPHDHEVNPLQSFNALISSLLILATWPQDQVLHLLKPTNKVGNIVLAHFCAIRFIVAPLSAPESTMRTPVKGIIDWCEMVLAAVKDDEEVKWKQYVEWPARIVRSLRCCVDQKRGFTFGDIHNIVIKDPDALREGRLSTIWSGRIQQRQSPNEHLPRTSFLQALPTV